VIHCLKALLSCSRGTSNLDSLFHTNIPPAKLKQNPISENENSCFKENESSSTVTEVTTDTNASLTISNLIYKIVLVVDDEMIGKRIVEAANLNNCVQVIQVGM